MKMKLCFRHYGESDKIPIEYISQIPGVGYIVSAVYDADVGQVWRRESIERISRSASRCGMKFSVVESIPVHENIKLGGHDRDRLIDNYAENIRRVAEAGVDCVTYNFMPIFDWTRTQLNKVLPDGSTSLVMYKNQLEEIDPARDNLSLPGWDSSYTREEITRLMAEYKALGNEGLWENLKYFLGKIIPVAESCRVKMAIHPDDPPYSVFGIPRIITCEENIDRMLNLYVSPSNCLCFCTGSLGCANSNNIPKMIEKYVQAGKIAFMHIRNVKNLPDGSFEETAHLSSCGSMDMFEIVKILVENSYDGYVRPDHGRMIWDEVNKEGVAPGYGLYDRALGATYLNGLFEACEKMIKEGKYAE